jgi:hypothetical protein
MMDYLNFIEHYLINKLVQTVGQDFNHDIESWNKVFEKNHRRFQYYLKLVHIAEEKQYGALVDLETVSVYPIITFQQYIDKKMTVSHYGNAQLILTEFQRNMSDTESSFYKNMTDKYEQEKAESVLKNRLIYFACLVLDKKNGKMLTSTQELRVNQREDIKPYLTYVYSAEKLFDDDIENKVLDELAKKYEYAHDHVNYYRNLYDKRRGQTVGNVENHSQILFNTYNL